MESGADLVLELPLPWAVSSAEGFAAGGVQALAATGVVEHLLFGSECGDVSALERVAACAAGAVLPRPAPRGAAWSGELCRCPAWALTGLLPEGGRRPAGVSQQHFGHRVLQGPAGQNAPPPAGDHPEGGQQPTTAPWRRTPPLGLGLPGSCGRGNGRRPCPCCLRPWPALMSWKRSPAGPPVFWENSHRAILARLRSMTAADFAALDQGREGIWNRLYDASALPPSLPEQAGRSQDEALRLARLRRMVLWAYLGLTPGDMPERVPLSAGAGGQWDRLPTALPDAGGGSRAGVDQAGAGPAVAWRPGACLNWRSAPRTCIPWRIPASAAGGTEWREGP